MNPSEYSMVPYLEEDNNKPKNKHSMLQREADRLGLLLPTQYNGTTPPVDDASEQSENHASGHKSDDDSLLLPPNLTET